MALTATALKNAKPKAKPYKLADEKGLFVTVSPSGGMLWRWKYRVDGVGADGQPASLRTEVIRSAHYVPQEGMLLMAPSHYEHWTIPSGLDEERISIAFDIVSEAHGVLPTG